MYWLVGAYYAKDDIVDSNRTLLGQNANVTLMRTVGQSLLGTPNGAKRAPGVCWRTVTGD